MSTTIFLIIYFIVAIALMGRLLLYGMRPTKTLAWLLAIFTIPIGGMLFYFIMGRNRRKRKFYKLKKTKEISQYLAKVNEYYDSVGKTDQTLLPAPIRDQIKLVKLLTKSSKFLPTTGNDLRVLKNGPITFNAIFPAMEKARYYINIQYYIFEDGKLAQQFLAILQQKAKEGVKVRFIYDHFGSRLLSRRYIKQLKKAGIEVYSFLPMRFGRLISSINYRNHRKIVIVDGAVAFTGGINVSDKYIDGHSVLGIWHDTHLQLTGPIVNSLQAVFAMDWSFASGNDDVFSADYFLKKTEVGTSIAQTVASGPDSDFSSIQQLYFSIVNKAEKYVYIINPYIIPGESLLDALQVAALSGVDVRLLLSSNSDSHLVKWTVRSYFEDFLKAGVKIYLYPTVFLHSKVILSDDAITSIGTANLDIRSFEENYEVNVLIYDKRITADLKQDFLRDCKISHQINYQDYLKRSKVTRLKEGIAKVFSPVL
ncbi:MAG: cardiolipin synthase [Aequorivita sp.]